MFFGGIVKNDHFELLDEVQQEINAQKISSEEIIYGGVDNSIFLFGNNISGKNGKTRGIFGGLRKLEVCREFLEMERDFLGRKALFWGGNEKILIISDIPRVGRFILGSVPPGVRFRYDEGRISINSNSLTFTGYMRINASKKNLTQLIAGSVKESLQKKEKVGIMFSGGVDSTTIAQVSKKYCKSESKPILISVGFEDSEDVGWAERISRKLGMELLLAIVDEEKVLKTVEKIQRLFPYKLNLMDEEIGAIVQIASETAKQKGLKHLITGQGSEELFAGYERHKSYSECNLNYFLFEELRGLHLRDLDRNNVIAESNGINLIAPFLNEELISFCSRIPPYEKRRDEKKQLLRNAAKELGVPDEVCRRKKRAMQYGSGIHGFLMKQRKKMIRKGL